MKDYIEICMLNGMSQEDAEGMFIYLSVLKYIEGRS